MRPKVSFEVICQDEEFFIGQMLRWWVKLAEAVQFPVEFVIVDGGSVDKTLDIIHPFLEDKRFRLYQNPWPGFPEQRNYMYSKLRGEWIMPCAADAVADDTMYRCLEEYVSQEDVLTWSFGKIHLKGDTDHMIDRAGRDPIIGLHKNLPEFEWGGDGLEHLRFQGKAIAQHPAHFNFKGQRYTPKTMMIHFEDLRPLDQMIAKHIKRAKISRSKLHGWTDERIGEWVRRNKEIRGCEIKKWHPIPPTFYTEM